jgi:hypothetical protein
MSKILGRDEVNFLAGRKTKTVELPEMDCSVILMELSKSELDTISNDIVDQLALMIVDDKKKRLYATAEGKRQLAELPLSICTQLITAGAELNGASKSAVEAAIKNSQSGPSTASASV